MCPTDPLLFTCAVNETTSTSITVAFPLDVPIILLSTDVVVGDLPDGVTVFHNVINNDYILSLSVETASLLNGGMITCDSGVIGKVDMAGCPVAREFN